MNGEIERLIQEVLCRKERPDLRGLIRGCELCLLAEGKSPNYTALIITSTNLFIRYLEVNEQPMDAAEIGVRQIRGFIRHLQSANRFASHPYAKAQVNGLSGHTVNTYTRSLKAFWSWLEAEGIIEANPFSNLSIPRAPKKIIPIFTEEQIKALLARVDTSSPQGFRNYVIILVLLDTMIRVSELTLCQMEDLNLEGRTLKVWGKGSKERIIPFGKTVQRALWRYITLYRPESLFPRQDRLFLTHDGRPMTKNRVEALVKAYGQKAGIKGVRVSPHTFRHTGAVAFLRNGGDLFTLQRIMGHSSLEVLRGYVNLNHSDLSRIHAQASPLDNIGIAVPRSRRLGKKLDNSSFRR